MYNNLNAKIRFILFYINPKHICMGLLEYKHKCLFHFQFVFEKVLIVRINHISLLLCQ